MIYPFLSLYELLSSDTQSMFSDIFAQIKSRFNPNHSETTIHDPRTRDAAISTIDNGIDATRQFLCSLLTRRNALVPISLLPPEILARVFHLLVIEEPPLSENQNLGWVRVTHVCRHWRQVALGDSSLWAKIWGIPTNTQWIPEILVRAKNVPLDIELNVAASSISEVFLMIPPDLSHVCQLRLHNLSLLHCTIIRQIFNWEAPALEHFELTVAAYPPRVITFSFPDIIGNMLFKGHAPRLRAFSLSRVIVPWSLVPHGQLTQLKIACPNEDVHSPGDLNQLIDLLVNCSALEILALEFCLPSQLTEFPHGQTIHLPHLSRLRLWGSTSRIMNMLNMLKLPSSTTLHLDCISNTTFVHDSLEEDLLLRIISAHFRNPAPVEFKSLTVTTRRHMTGSLNIVTSTFPFTLSNHETQNIEGDIVGNPELVLSFNRLSKPGHSTDLLKQACKMLPISNLEFISMSAANIIDINWVELFSCCTNIITMQAIGLGTSSFVRALTPPTVTNAGSSEQARKRNHNDRASTLVQVASTVTHGHATIFPKLKFLGLTKLDFSERELTSGMLLDVLERGLQQRMTASGAPLTLLRISGCKISTKRANDLRKLVQDFHWDENEDLVDTGEVVFVGPGIALGDWDSDPDIDADGLDSYSEGDIDADRWGDYSD